MQGFRFASSTLAAVQGAVLKPNTTQNRFSTDAILEAAGGWDDGNQYLNKKELMAGAFELQLRETRGSLTADDLAAIKNVSGVSTAGPAPDATVPATPANPPAQAGLQYTEDLTSASVRTLLAQHIPTLDVKELEEAADEVIDNRDGSRNDQFTFTVEPNQDGSVDVTLSTNFDYDGTDFGHYTSFNVDSSGGWQLTDAGAD